MYITKGLREYTWEINNAPEMEKRRIIKSLNIPQVLSDLGEETFQDRINALWNNLDKLKSFVASGITVKLPDEVKKSIGNIVEGTSKNYVPILIGVSAVAIAGYFIFGRKK